MALFTLQPPVVTKTIAASFAIDYNELASWDAVPAGYHKDVNNWKEVFIQMKHSGSNQKATIQFKLPGTSGDLSLTDAARAGTWEIYSVVIRDYDRGEVAIFPQDIPNRSSYSFLVKSNATHGDLFVGNGQIVTISSGKKQYGDFIIEAGGVLKIADGGGISEIEVTETCIVNGLILANNGKHSGGTWSSTSVLGESLTYTVAQKAGGNGGAGQGDSPIVGHYHLNDGVDLVADIYFNANGSYSLEAFGEADEAGQPGIETGTYTWNSATGDLVISITSDANGEWGLSHAGALKAIVINGGANVEIYEDNILQSTIDRIGSSQAGGQGGISAFGQGAGGGRAAIFGALQGGDPSAEYAGVGAGQDDAAADAYGEDGADSVSASEAGSGGFKGAHGQAIYIKARKIQGTGTINVSGQKGGDGGNGGEYNVSGIMYGNAAGGGAAGGSGGKIWLRYKVGTPALNLVVTGGDKGNRGTKPNANTTDAGHGVAGDAGSVSLQTWV
jgi:hypothetical protein